MQLFDYQEQAIEFIGRRKKVYLALDMGMGKTLTSLVAGDMFAKKGILVIAEKNEIVNSKNFEREVRNFIHRRDYVSLRDHDLDFVRKAKRPMVCGINPDGLDKLDLEELKELFDFVIIDEATMAKTTSTTRFKRIRKLCKEMEYVVLLSGTPMMNGASEIYAPLLLLGHKLAGNGTAEARRAFESIFAGGHRRKIHNTGKWFLDYTWWAKGANHVRELRYLIRDNFFFKRKTESAIFHKKLRTVEQVPMTMEWLAEYNQAWDAYLKEAGARGVDMDNVMELQRLIENGQCYQVNSQWKAPRVVDDIKKGRYGNQRIIIFTMFVDTYERLQTILKYADISFKTFDELQEWRDGDEQVLLGRIKAHGKGGNISKASVVLFVDMDFVPANNIQAENRVDRPEQTRDMTIVYYMAEGEDIVDTHVRNINKDKTRKIEAFMEPLTEEEIKAMPRAIAALKEKYARDVKALSV